MPINLSHEVRELILKIILLLCKKYGFDDLTTDYNENHGKHGWFASSNASGTSSSKQEGKEKSAKRSAKTEAPQALHPSAKVEAPAGAVSEEGTKMCRKILKEPKKVNRAAQRQHINKENADAATKAEQRASKGKNVLPKSYFTEDFASLCNEVIGKIRDNQFRETTGRGNDTRFQVDLDRKVGIAYNEDGTKSFPTNVVELVYSHKSGYHMWPARKKEGKK